MDTSRPRLNPPFRAEHIGSLVRPPALYQKRAAFEKKECTIEELRSAEDAAVKDAVKLQREVGIKTITDGELRRGVFFEGVFENLEGVTNVPNRPITTFKPYVPHIALMYSYGLTESESMYCTGKIRRARPFYKEHFESLKALVPPEDVKYIKVTMCAPSWYHQRHGSDFTYDTSIYKNDDEYFDDIGKAYREEIKELYDLGCRHIQIDDPTFCYFCSEFMISGMEKAGIDHEALLSTYIRAINVCIQDRPSDMRVGVHMCRGNFTGGVHFAEGSYDRIAVKLFRDLNVDTYYLEYDTNRAGDFKALGHLPLGKVAVLGLVTTKNPQLENVEDLKARIENAVDAICKANPGRTPHEALNQLCISTQCGFASTWQGNPVTVEDQRNKLDLLVKAAKEIWKE